MENVLKFERPEEEMEMVNNDQEVNQEEVEVEETTAQARTFGFGELLVAVAASLGLGTILGSATMWLKNRHSQKSLLKSFEMVAMAVQMKDLDNNLEMSDEVKEAAEVAMNNPEDVVMYIQEVINTNKFMTKREKRRLMEGLAKILNANTILAVEKGKQLAEDNLQAETVDETVEEL